MSAPTGSQLTLAGATIAVAQPIERLLKLLAGVHVEDLKWALSMAAGLAIGATGLYLHLAEKRERGRLRLERLEDEARRARQAADADERRKQELLDLEQRIRVASLAREIYDGPDRQAGGLKPNDPQ